MADYHELLALSDQDLGRVDPVVRNLLVAKGIPSLAHLDIPDYQRRCDEWSDVIWDWLPRAEQEFWQTPHLWKNDVNFFRLGLVHQFLEQQVGIEYNDEQRTATQILYTNPCDLFLNGVMDTKRGTCGNMAALHVAIGWRLAWPVSLACVKSHLICRYDDGKVTHNIEATQAGFGGFKSDPDEYLIERFQLPPVAIASGSDLRALTPRETLGVFVGLKARHMRDIGQVEEAQADYLLARWLFPNSRRLYIDSMALTVPYGVKLFDPGEIGSPESLAEWLVEQYGSPIGPSGPISVQSTTLTSLG